MKEEDIARIVREHRRCRSVYSGSRYECICGEPVSSNSHHVQSRHIAQKVVAYLAEENDP